MKYLNLTHRVLRIHHQGGLMILPMSGATATVHLDRRQAATLWTDDGHAIEMARVVSSCVTGLPEPQPGVYLITSGVVAAIVKRPDVLSPGLRLRDANGNDIGNRGLNCHA